MASIGKDSGGRKRILFVARDGKRKTIRLGRASKWQAAMARGHVENLVAAATMRQAPPAETAAWVAALPDVLRKRLAAVGLADGPGPKPEQAAPLTLGAFLDAYLTGRTDLKLSTRVALGQAVRLLVEHFGPDRPLRTITPGDADDWPIFLKARGLAEATIRRRCGQAKQMFRAATRKGFLPANPFGDLKAGNVANDGRQFNVDVETVQKVLAACPDVQWRLIFGLCRFGGLRCPSEVLGLRWADIHWDQDRFTVHSPKTAHHAGHESRQVPIVPELLAVLREGFEAAEPGTEHVITRYRRSNANLSTQLRRILWRASLTPWPRLFQNLRASFATDLAKKYPAYLAARWLGHTPLIAAKHYDQVLDSDFAAASATPLLASTPGAVCRAAQLAGGAAQKAAHSGAIPRYQALSGQPSQEDETAFASAGQRVTAQDSDVSTSMVGDTGLEPVTSCVSSRRSSHLS